MAKTYLQRKGNPGPAGDQRPLLDSLRLSLGMCYCATFRDAELCPQCARVIAYLRRPTAGPELLPNRPKVPIPAG
jgi:hypothetical protein